MSLSPNPVPPVNPQNPIPPEGALDFMWQAFSNLNEWVRFSDTKAAAVLSADGVIVGVLGSILLGTSNPAKFAIFWMILIVIATFYSAGYALLSLLPQLKIKSVRNATSTTSEEMSSLIFFMDIEKKFPTSKEFHDKITSELANPDQAVREITHQVWCNSKVAVKKFRHVEKSLMGLAVALGLGFFGVIILAVLKILI